MKESVGKDLVTFKKRYGLQFNFLPNEIDRSGDGNEYPFWNKSLRRVNLRAISLQILKSEEVSIQNLRKLDLEYVIIGYQSRDLLRNRKKYLGCVCYLKSN
jgi:hypothetical protein